MDARVEASCADHETTDFVVEIDQSGRGCLLDVVQRFRQVLQLSGRVQDSPRLVRVAHERTILSRGLVRNASIPFGRVRDGRDQHGLVPQVEQESTRIGRARHVLCRVQNDRWWW